MIEYKSRTREEQLQELSDFIEKTQEEIVDIASALNWSIETVVNDSEKYLTCPYDSSHRISKESLERHLSSCQWKAEGYTEYDLPLSEPSSACGPMSCIKFDTELQNNVLRMAKEQNPEMRMEYYQCYTWHGLRCSGERLIPRTSDRLLTDFTSDERKALYEYVVSNTVKPDIGQDIADIHQPKSEQKTHELSFLELLVQERNLKRRRAKHRGVHTNKKSHTEILREVINQQMEMYSSYLEEVRGPSPTATTSKDTATTFEELEEDSWSKDSKQYDSCFKQSYGYRSSRRYEKRARSGDKYSHRSKEHDYRDDYSPETKKSRRQRNHEHRRSRSPGRRHGVEDKHRSKHESHRRKHKSRESEKSDNYSRRNGDRRKERDRY